MLHMADLAVNKVMAAAGRREARDLVDLVTVHEQFLPLGAIVSGCGRNRSWLHARGLDCRDKTQRPLSGAGLCRARCLTSYRSGCGDAETAGGAR